jgi:hypothetical protein
VVEVDGAAVPSLESSRTARTILRSGDIGTVLGEGVAQIEIEDAKPGPVGSDVGYEPLDLHLQCVTRERNRADHIGR